MTPDDFIARWTGLEGGAERANYALFLSELCDVIGVPRPDPASASSEKNDYVFERLVRRPDGSNGRIDLYKRDAFVLEAKQSRQSARTLTGEANDKYLADAPRQLALGLGDDPAPRGRRTAKRAWDVLMLNARQQAEDYARHLPQDHGWPPFVVVCDVGHSLELFADFGRMGKYEQFPDRQNFRIFMTDLRDAKVRERLCCIWTDPYVLDPTKQAAKTTREIAKGLAEITKALEAKKANAEDVAHFLMRCIFTMFAASWKLLPENSFKHLLERSVADPAHFPRRMKELWAAMDKGGFSIAIDADVRHFNGDLFSQTTAFELGREEIGELLAAAKADWREVEPAIFGTLLEQALDPKERKKLGAHYTPRAYVERLVTATVIDPLREDWRVVLTTAEERRAAGDDGAAVAAVQAFHDKLCETRVLDPACGTGNFLYVSLELMKRLEGEVLEALLDLGGQEALTGLEGHTVDPHQFLGLELNPRAAAIAKLVLWIGYLQQHFRINGAAPGDPILKAFRNINFGKPGGYDAVLTWDGYPVTKVMNGIETYLNARRPEWPEAEFIVGNPPFIGNKRMKKRLGASYVETLRKLYPEVAGSVDFVMFWVSRAGDAALKGRTRALGLVSTNSISQPLNRPVMDRLMAHDSPLFLAFAIPDHPWVDTEKMASVRVAMFTIMIGRGSGRHETINTGSKKRGNSAILGYKEQRVVINPNLTTGTDYGKLDSLRANDKISQQGVILVGEGFRVSAAEREKLVSGDKEIERRVRPYLIGEDLTDIAEERYVVDLNDLSQDGARTSFPTLYQLVVERVKPERDENDDPTFKKAWWRWGRPRPEIAEQASSLGHYIATCRTARHRTFTFLSSNIVPDAKIIFVGNDDPGHLAILSSSAHLRWAEASGAWLGVGNDSNYNHSECFAKFPFPQVDSFPADLRAAGEELDAFRKTRQAEHPRLTLTQMYNVRETLLACRALTPEEERIKNEGLILILNELHDRIDRLTFEAYGWPQGLSDEEMLERLVALNKERADEERRGIVRWLRPEYQKARAGVVELKAETTPMDLGAVAVKATKPAFPVGPIDQGAAVAAALFASPAPIDATTIAMTFKQGRKVEPKITAILQAMSRIGAAATRDGGKTFQGRRAA